MEITKARIDNIPEGFAKKEANVRTKLIMQEINKAPEEYRAKLLDDLIKHLKSL